MLGFLGPVMGMVGSIFGGGGGIVKSLIGGIKNIIKAKQDLAKSKQYVEGQIRLKAMGIEGDKATHDIKWDLIMAEASKGSWKDEFWTLTFGAVFWMAFIDPDRLQVGLNALALMDGDMKILIGTCVAAAFGRAEITKWKKRK